MQQEVIWRIELFGGLRARRGAQTIERFRTRKTGALLAYLAFHRGLHRRESLIEMLWPDVSPETGRNNLRLALASLRRQLEPNVGERGRFLQADRLMAGLNREVVTTDVVEFEAILNDKSTFDAIAPLQRAVGLYQGRLLPDFYEDWIPLEEQRLEDHFLRALDCLIDLLEQSGEYRQAQEYTHLGARIDPQRWETRPISGRLSTLAAYDRHNKPYAAIPAQRAQNQETLPLFPTRFIGRQREITELVQWLASPSNRLITLTGTGGAGKTRLGVETLRFLSGRCGHASQQTVQQTVTPDIHFVTLAELTDTSLLDSALAERLNLSPPPGSDSSHEVVKALAAYPAILMLDNFEQLLPEGASWIRTLLDNTTDLTLLLSSRVKLNLPAEREYALQPLPLPAPLAAHDETKWKAHSLEALGNNESVQLFVDRARSVRPEFRITSQNAVAVSRVLQKLEGVPLAIELIAARAGVLSPAQMVTRLERVLDFPSAPDDNRVVRHRSLRAVIAWSYQLLSPELREFFRSLAVFRGDFSEKAAHFVSGSAPTLDSLSQLRDSSLLQAHESACGEMRFRLLEMLREYALEYWTQDDKQTWPRRHARYFLAWAEHEDASGPNTIGRTARMALEIDNIRAALDWAVAHDETETALCLGSALWWFWPKNSYLEEGRRWMKRIMAMPAASTHEQAWLRALRCAGWLALHEGDYESAQAHLEDALAEARRLDDQSVIAGVLNMLGGVAHWRNELAQAYRRYNESLALHRARSNRHDLAVALTSLAGVALALGKTDEVQALCREAIPLWRELADKGGIAWVLNVQGIAAARAGDFITARAQQEKSLKLRRAINSRAGEATALHDLAEINRSEGHLADALQVHEQSLQIRRELYHKPDIAVSLFSLGCLAREVGDHTRALEYLHESLLLYLEMNNEKGVAQCREELSRMPLYQSL